MRVAGIDVSSRFVDIVFVDADDLWEDEPPTWQRYKLAGHDAWERCRSIGQLLPGPHNTVWDDVLAIGVEVAHGPSSGIINRCVGAVLAQLPPNVLVNPLTAPQWKKAVGLGGNAKKPDVAKWANEQRAHSEAVYASTPVVTLAPWPQDALDALGIALATRGAVSEETGR